MARLTEIERAERTLAKLVQNAKVKGLGWTAYAEYRNAEGWGCTKQQAVKCCARGAANLSSPPVWTADNVTLGNDYPDRSWHDDPGIYFDIGAAFRDVMTHEENA